MERREALCNNFVTVAAIQKELEATVVDIHIKGPVSLRVQIFILHIFESLF